MMVLPNSKGQEAHRGHQHTTVECFCACLCIVDQFPLILSLSIWRLVFLDVYESGGKAMFSDNNKTVVGMLH